MMYSNICSIFAGGSTRRGRDLPKIEATRRAGKRAADSKTPAQGGCCCNGFLPSPAHAVRVGEGGPLAVEGVSAFEDGKNAVEELRQPAERAAVDLAAELAVVAARHLLAAAVTVSVVAFVGVAEGGDRFGVGVPTVFTDV